MLEAHATYKNICSTFNQLTEESLLFLEPCCIRFGDDMDSPVINENGDGMLPLKLVFGERQRHLGSMRVVTCCIDEQWILIPRYSRRLGREENSEL